MAKVDPYRTKKRTKVYHVYKDCHLGNNIDPGNPIKGKGGRRMCSACKRRAG